MRSSQNEITEKYILIKNDLEVKNEITAKVAADFAVSFYRAFREEYDEEACIYLIKKVMDFFNRTIAIIPEKSNELNIEKLLENVKKTKQKVNEKAKVATDKSNNKIVKEDVPKKEELVLYEKQYRDINKEINELLDNKPNFFLRRHWKKKIKERIISLNSLENEVQKYYESFSKKNKEKNKTLETSYLDIREKLKEFMREEIPNIGEVLANISYEEIIVDEETLKSFIQAVVFQNFHEYYNIKYKKLNNINEEES